MSAKESEEHVASRHSRVSDVDQVIRVRVQRVRVTNRHVELARDPVVVLDQHLCQLRV